MVWRIYRLPGSREMWHVDNGDETQIINVRGFTIYGPCFSVDRPQQQPRAWIEIPDGYGFELHIIGGIAVWAAAEYQSAPSVQVVADSAERVLAQV